MIWKYQYFITYICGLWSTNNRGIEWLRLERSLKITELQPHCHGLGVTHQIRLPSLEHLQGWPWGVLVKMQLSSASSFPQTCLAHCGMTIQFHDSDTSSSMSSAKINSHSCWFCLGPCCLTPVYCWAVSHRIMNILIVFLTTDPLWFPKVTPPGMKHEGFFPWSVLCLPAVVFMVFFCNMETPGGCLSLFPNATVLASLNTT